MVANDEASSMIHTRLLRWGPSRSLNSVSFCLGTHLVPLLSLLDFHGLLNVPYASFVLSYLLVTPCRLWCCAAQPS